MMRHTGANCLEKKPGAVSQQAQHQPQLLAPSWPTPQPVPWPSLPTPSPPSLSLAPWLDPWPSPLCAVWICLMKVCPAHHTMLSTVKPLLAVQSLSLSVLVTWRFKQRKPQNNRRVALSALRCLTTCMSCNAHALLCQGQQT